MTPQAMEPTMIHSASLTPATDRAELLAKIGRALQQNDI